jgi:hypothetical protein
LFGANSGFSKRPVRIFAGLHKSAGKRRKSVRNATGFILIIWQSVTRDKMTLFQDRQETKYVWKYEATEVWGK